MAGTTTVPLRMSTVSESLAPNRLGIGSVIIFVWSAATPLTVVAGVVTTGFATTGLTGVPLAFVLVSVVLLTFAVGYVAMSRRIANAGAFYSYAAQGLGRPVGVGTAWVALIAYNSLQAGLYGIVGAAAAPVLQDWFGVEVTWWAIAGVAWLVTAIMGMLDVEINKWFLAALLLAEVTVIVLFSIASLLHPADGSVSFETLSPDNLFGPGLGAVLVMAVLGFVGFEASTSFSEEAKDPKRTVAGATYLSVILIAGLYTLASWAMTVAVGPVRIVEVAQAESTEVLYNLAGAHLGGWAVQLGHTLFITSVLAAMVTFHNIVSRYVFALGRERVLPGGFGRTSARSRAPRAASLLQSTVGLAAIVVFAVGGWDPVVHLFFVGGTAGALGVLLLITITSVSVIGFFHRHPGRESAWQRLIAPGIAAGVLAVIAYLAFDNLASLLGVRTDHPLIWLIPTTYVGIGVIGVAWAFGLKALRPGVYERIGLGAHSATAAAPALGQHGASRGTR